MKRYKAVAATINKTIESWGGTSEFTEEALKQLSKTAFDKPVLIGFDPARAVGKVVFAVVEDGKLIVEVDLDEGYTINQKERLVPDFVVDIDEWKEGAGIHRIIRKASSFAYGLTESPCEKDLPEIVKEVVKEEMTGKMPDAI